MEKQYPQRKSPRLQGYDYSQNGAYFITICTHQRKHLFGSVESHEMNLTVAGKIAEERWYTLPKHHPNMECDLFVVMPNHVHGIILLFDDDNVGTRPALSHTCKVKRQKDVKLLENCKINQSEHP